MKKKIKSVAGGRSTFLSRQTSAILTRTGHFLPRGMREKLVDKQITQMREESGRIFELNELHIQDIKLSHDVLNHLQILNWALIRADFNKTNPKKAFNCIESAQREITFLNEIIRRYRQGISVAKKPTAFFKFVNLIKNTVGGYCYFPKNRKMVFESNLSKDNKRNRLSIDNFGLKRVVVNLLENANEAIGIETGEIKVKMTLQGDKISIIVSDTGKGMSEKQIRDFHNLKLFSVETGAQHGIGLVNAKEMVNWHGGTINVKSTLGKGTTVSIEIPISQ